MELWIVVHLTLGVIGVLLSYLVAKYYSYSWSIIAVLSVFCFIPIVNIVTIFVLVLGLFSKLRF